jgi:hypothetical protein
MEIKFTPGPWHLDTVVYDGNVTHTVRAPYYTEAVHFRKPKAGYTQAEREQHNADARLIAAAPELLSALVAMVRLAHDQGWRPEWTEISREAITKAIGHIPT